MISQRQEGVARSHNTPFASLRRPLPDRAQRSSRPTECLAWLPCPMLPHSLPSYIQFFARGIPVGLCSIQLMGISNWQSDSRWLSQRNRRNNSLRCRTSQNDSERNWSMNPSISRPCNGGNVREHCLSGFVGFGRRVTADVRNDFRISTSLWFL